MSFEAITAISKAEDEAKAAVLEAEALAKQMIAAAQDSGRKLVEAAGAKASSELAEQKRLAEGKAMDEAEALVRLTNDQKAALKTKAGERLEKAATLVVERIVNS